MKIFFLLIVLLLNLNMSTVRADVVVRMSLQQGLLQNNVDVRLFDQKAPLTVANFLKYADGATVNLGNYDNTLLHRSVANFVLQGGGFSFDTGINIYPDAVQLVPTDDPVLNEFNLSNIRGTIAMAKLNNLPDSATNQWFFNLVDNSANLDGQNGGFTVFGSIIGDGMTVIDGIASIPVFDKTADNSAFGYLPLVDYTEPDNVIPDNLVLLNSVIQLFSISEDLNFGLLQTGDSAQSVVTIENTSAGDIVIANLASTNSITTPFAMVDDACSGKTLVVAASCDITISFTSQLEGSFQDGFNIEFTTPVIDFEYAVSGAAAIDIAPNIVPSVTSLDYGVTQLYDSEVDPLGEYKVIHINNEGTIPLNILSVTLDGSSEFTLYDNCTLMGTIEPGGSCLLPVYFRSTSLGEISATLTIISDDPDQSSLTIPFSGLVDVDTDGIAESVESMAPNNGDGNMDGTVDSIQSHVSSFLALNSDYITLVTASDSEIRSVNVLQMSELAPVPDGLDFPLGVLDFEIKLPLFTTSAEVGLILPAGIIPQTYYMYGPTPDDTNPHWYEFMYDELSGTGAIILGDVNFTSPVDGSQITRSAINLMFKDGSRGDSDLVENGVITDPGGPVISNSASSGSGGGLSIFMLAGLVFMSLVRVRLKRTLI